MASKVTKMPVRGNMHMDTRVIKDAEFKSELKFHHFNFEAVWRPPWPQRQPKWQLNMH